MSLDSLISQLSRRARLRLFFLFLIGAPLLLWIAISPFVARRINHREWTQWAQQDLRALARAVEAYRAAEGAWPPALEHLTPIAEPRTSVTPKRRRTARPTPTPTPLPPELADAPRYIPHLPVDPYAPGFDFPRGRTYTYYLLGDIGAGNDIQFILLSPGPDRKIDIDPSMRLDPSTLSARAYDPTNGLVSGGDIFVTGPSGE